MKHLPAIIWASLLAFAAPAFAQDGGMLRTMPHGTYQCGYPGSAAGEAVERAEAEDFRLSGASRYRNAEGRGTYLLKGDVFTFTRGPKKGDRYIRKGENRLRKIDAAGNETRLLCVRRGS
ncbi:elongation factor P [Altererythrobacter sp. GH1-8]|uniref:elongation factor P n=1 Tax=Altererythrobacter sp. GH1-8 TaxID=3349333 RepID=UPI00374D59BD